jgi:hypothetical protein
MKTVKTVPRTKILMRLIREGTDRPATISPYLIIVKPLIGLGLPIGTSVVAPDHAKGVSNLVQHDEYPGPVTPPIYSSELRGETITRRESMSRWQWTEKTTVGVDGNDRPRSERTICHSVGVSADKATRTAYTGKGNKIVSAFAVRPRSNATMVLSKKNSRKSFIHNGLASMLSKIAIRRGGVINDF